MVRADRRGHRIPPGIAVLLQRPPNGGSREHGCRAPRTRPPAPPSSAAQIGPYFDGILRTAGFAFGAAVLALKSFLGMQIETQLAAPRRQREAMHLADLEMANRSLEAATRAKSDFLASMSHELRTPLNAVLGFSGLLTEQLGGTLAAQQTRFLSNIREAREHLLELINEALHLPERGARRQ